MAATTVDLFRCAGLKVDANELWGLNNQYPLILATAAGRAWAAFSIEKKNPNLLVIHLHTAFYSKQNIEIVFPFLFLPAGILSMTMENKMCRSFRIK